VSSEGQGGENLGRSHISLCRIGNPTPNGGKVGIDGMRKTSRRGRAWRKKEEESGRHSREHEMNYL